MAVVRIDKTIVKRLRPHDGLYKALIAFIFACQKDQPPPRIYKKSGIAADGSKFQPYIDLNLHHHHLHQKSDPILVTQNIEGVISSVALTTHAEYFQGDKMLWLQKHSEAIDWSNHPELEAQVAAHRKTEE